MGEKKNIMRKIKSFLMIKLKSYILKSIKKKTNEKKWNL